MDLNQSFIEAGTLMLSGMVFVFAFLGLLVVLINTVLKKLAETYPDPVVAPRAPKKSNKNNLKNTSSSSTVAAISAAVSQYRSQHANK